MVGVNMGISKMTAMQIQNWDDTDDQSKEGLLVLAAKDNRSGKWAGSMYLCKDGGIHTLLLSTTAIFDDEATAKKSIADVMAEIRSMDKLQL